ncbi:MAG: glycosyl hydrolase [Bacteroidota bacterium]
MINITKYLTLLLIFISQIVQAQPDKSSPDEIQSAVENREQLRENSIFKNYKVRNIGPVVQGGRIVDIAVNPEDQHEYYTAYASGGLYKTTNNGVTFEPIFDNNGILTIGDIAMAPSNPSILYLGTGENNSSRSSYAGSGIYKSIDGGENWTFAGLDGVQHTSRILVHPDNPDVVWLASIGNLYSKDEHRGVYKSNDGGRNWEKTLYISDSVGIIDLVLHPENPNQLLASAWERSRSAWNFKGNGPGSAIYKSEDGGNTWVKSISGFATGENVGRIGLDISESAPNVVYALLDNQTETKEEKEKPKDGKFQLGDFVEMSKDDFLKLEDEKLSEFLKGNSYPEKYTVERVKEDIRNGVYKPKALTEYFGDANRALFDTKVTGAELYRSEDFGGNWTKVNSYNLDGVFFTYGYYFGQVRVDPNDENKLYIFGVPLLKSSDGGKTFARIDTLGDVHVDHHDLWINPENSNHLVLGNDGGLYTSYDEGANWRHINNTSVGQFYTVNVDMEKPYNVYGGLQDNGVLTGSSKSIPNRTKKWERVFGGDGMFVSADPKNSDLVYTGYQFGNYYRIDRDSGKRKRITPQHDIGAKRLRFNWRTPVILSSHNADIVYFASQYVHRSLDMGDTWETISPDLTYDKPQGNVPYSTIVSLVESKLKFGYLYAGTDDGRVWVLKGAGSEWKEITEGLPQGQWVSSIHPSVHDEATVYVSLTGYRFDDFGTYIYKSDDYGKTWKDISSNVSHEAVNVILQDPVEPELLYLGTDHGTYISLNDGESWEMLNEIPNVASYDMIVHPRENELVVGTHGRSIYITDIKPLQKLVSEGLNQPITVFETVKIKHADNWGEKRFPYLKANEPKSSILYYIPSKLSQVSVEVKDEKGKVIREETTYPKSKGFNYYSWDLKMEEKKGKKKTGNLNYVDKGEYEIILKTGADSSSTKVVVD